jgi:hypothetical protein
MIAIEIYNVYVLGISSSRHREYIQMHAMPMPISLGLSNSGYVSDVEAVSPLLSPLL